MKSKMFMLLILLAAVVILFSAWAGIIGVSFFSLDTLIGVGDLLILTSFLAIGSGFLMVAGKMDLSASKIGAFSSVIMAAGLKYWGMPTGIVIPVTLICCVAFGILNAILVNEFNFAPFIATMAMAYVVQGVMYLVSVSPETGSPMSINFSNTFSRFIANAKLFGVPVTLILAIAMFIIYGLILSKSKFGMKIYLVGGNPQAANLVGINPKKITYILYANSAFLAGIAGILYMGRSSQGDLTALMQNQFTGLTASILGGVSFGGGKGNMAGVFIGLIILNTFSKGTMIVGLSNYWTTVLSGLLLLIALGTDYYSEKKTKKK